jgi:hypothetical protein
MIRRVSINAFKDLPITNPYMPRSHLEKRSYFRRELGYIPHPLDIIHTILWQNAADVFMVTSTRRLKAGGLPTLTSGLSCFVGGWRRRIYP